MASSTVAPSPVETGTANLRKDFNRTISMIPAPTIKLDPHRPAECCGTVMSITWEEEKEKEHPNKIMKDVRFFCESPAMIEFCEKAGLKGCKFSWNPAHKNASRIFQHETEAKKSILHSCKKNMHSILHHNNKLFDRFWDAYEQDPNLHSVSVVFHGSPEKYIPTILKNGLDPKFRRTQAFGKGEYFAKEPGLATTYCKGGHKLVVFLVFMPKDLEKYYSQRDRDIVCVSDIAHELPIGVLSFEDTDEAVVQHTQDLRIEQKKLKDDAVEKEDALKKAKEEGADAATIEKLEKKVKAAWDYYFTTRLDENRNSLDHLRRMSSVHLNISKELETLEE